MSSTTALLLPSMPTKTAQQGYSDEAVADLLVQYRETRNERLRDRIVEEMRPLVHHVARKFAGREPIEDLESEGYVGLIRAVDRFVPERGTRFSTFAMHLIAGQMRHYLRDRGHLIRQPAWLQELNTRVQRAASELEQKLQRQPTTAELAALTNLTEEGIEELVAARQAAQIVRMEAPAETDEESFLDVDPEKFRSRTYVTLELPLEDRIALEGALDKLKELERTVLYYFFYQEFNQSEIARTLGISCNYAGYVLRKGLKQMRERMPDDPAVRRRLVEGETVVDPATGVYSAEHFDRRLGEEIVRAVRFDQPVSVCCLRMAGECGEATLKAIADLLRSRVRKADVIGRTGPVEFGLIFPGTSDAAPRVAARLADEIHGQLRVRLHTAAASFPENGRTARQLYEAASRAALLAEPPTSAPVKRLAGV